MASLSFANSDTALDFRPVKITLPTGGNNVVKPGDYDKLRHGAIGAYQFNVYGIYYASSRDPSSTVTSGFRTSGSYRMDQTGRQAQRCRISWTHLDRRRQVLRSARSAKWRQGQTRSGSSLQALLNVFYKKLRNPFWGTRF